MNQIDVSANLELLTLSVHLVILSNSVFTLVTNVVSLTHDMEVYTKDSLQERRILPYLPSSEDNVESIAAVLKLYLIHICFLSILLEFGIYFDI